MSRLRLAFLLLGLLCVVRAHAGSTFTVTVDTTPLVGIGPFTLDIQFIDGTGLPGDLNNNTITLGNFSFGGGSAVGGGTAVGGASGSLPAGITLHDTSFFNEYLQDFQPGTLLKFDVSVTNVFNPSGIPDLFTVAILDSSGIELPTTGFANEFVAISLEGGAAPVVTAAGSTPGSQFQIAVPSVQGSQSITFTSSAPSAATVGGATYNVTATGGASGNPVTFSIDATASAVCSIAGSTVSFIGTGTCVIDANQAGNANYATAAQVQQSFTVSAATTKTNQSITFNKPTNKTMLQSPVTVSATASSGLPVTFTTTTPAVCTPGGTNGETITLVAKGTCTVQANQAGNAVYAAATAVNRSFTVSQASQTITFTVLTKKTLLESPVTVAATASSGLTVTFTTTTPLVCTAGGVNGSTITLAVAGTCTVKAVQAGDATYKPATAVSRSFAVVNPTQTITFNAVTNKTMLQSPVNVTAKASSGLAVTFTTTTPAVCTPGGVNGSPITLEGAGTCKVQADQAGNAAYFAAPPVQRSFNVSRVNQAITFSTLANKTLAQSSVTVTAKAASGLTVTFTTTTPLVCTAGGTNGATITLVGTGTCTVRADQAGDATYNPASAVTRNFVVS